MKLRHVVALALVGWYVLIPPTRNNLALDLQAPLSRWVKFKSFESFHDCVLGAGELNQRANGDPNVRPSLKFTQMELRQFSEAVCVSDDDPRLKEK